MYNFYLEENFEFRSGITMHLQQETTLQQFLDLEQRKELWVKRVKSCMEAGKPDMVAACTKRHVDINNPDNIKGFELANETFRDGVLGFIWNFFRDLPEQPRIGLELFVGPGIFFRELIQRIPNLYGVDLIEENLEYTKRYTEEHPGHLLCRPAHCIEKEVGERYGYPDGFNKEDFDIIFAFRGYLHQPRRERIQTLLSCIKILKPGGYLVIGEMFEDDRPENRKINPGAFYWKIGRYKRVVGKYMSLAALSEIIDNDGDPCRVAIFKKD